MRSWRTRTDGSRRRTGAGSPCSRSSRCCSPTSASRPTWPSARAAPGRRGGPRALAADPRLLLLDEPLAALDVGAAPEVRRVLRQVLRGEPRRSAVLVTHDLLDALALADRVVVLDGGRVVEEGPAAAVVKATAVAVHAVGRTPT